MEQLVHPDHDLMVTLNVKVDQILAFQADHTIRISRLEARADAEDLYHAKIPLKELMESAGEWDRFQSNFKFIMASGGFALATFGAILGRLIEKWFKF